MWLENYLYYFSEEATEDEAFEVITKAVNHLWQQCGYQKKVIDDTSQWELISSQRQKYRFPDYLSLVGEPSANDYYESCVITVNRKAELMLIGAFFWHGMTIALHAGVWGWNFRGEPNWEPHQEGWT